MEERTRDRSSGNNGLTSSGNNSSGVPSMKGPQMTTSSPQRIQNASPVIVTLGGMDNGDPSSPGDGEDGGFQERLIPRKTSVETQTMTDDTFYQRKITPRVPKRKCLQNIVLCSKYVHAVCGTKVEKN